MKDDKYLILRNNIKISDEKFSLKEAENEVKRWQNIIKKWPDGSKITMKKIETEFKV